MNALLTFLPLVLLPLAALAHSDCDAELAEIDRRIATGSYPDMNVALAQQMRTSIEQMCPMLDTATRAQMMTSIEDILPTRSEEERRADKEAKRAAAKAAREARRTAKESNRVSTKVADSRVMTVPNAGHSVASGFVDRNEDMLHFWVWDWDVYKSKTRVLYMTQPSRVQYGRPDWTRNIYVVIVDANGRTTQRLITSKQAHEKWTVALRRHHDEVILQRQTGADGSSTTLERWSISHQKMISSVTTPLPTFEHADKASWHHFATATSDGNIMFVAAFEPARGKLSASWYKATPDGRVLGYGQLPMDGGAYTNLGAIATDSGGAAVPVLLATDRQVTRRFDKTEISAKVMKEMHLLSMDGNGSPNTSPVIATTILPEITDMAGMAYAAEIEHALMANRSIENLDIAPRSLPAMQSLNGGYLILTKFVGDRRRPEPVHGHWLVWVGKERIEREVYLNPLAEALNITIKMFDTAPNGDIILYGDSKQHTGTDYIVVLDSAGTPKSKVPAKQPNNGSIKALIAEDNGVWLIGNGYPTDEFSRYRLWFERIATN